MKTTKKVGKAMAYALLAMLLWPAVVVCAVAFVALWPGIYFYAVANGDL